MGATEGFMRAEIEKLEEENRNLKEEVKKLKRRIDTMQDFIDYGESIVKEVIELLYCNEYAEAIDKLEGYPTGDDRQYELMEEYDGKEESLENRYITINTDKDGNVVDENGNRTYPTIYTDC